LENEKKYGLSLEHVANIRLPAAKYLVEIYDINKITNSKSKLSTVEKMNHLIKLEEALANKLQLLKDKKITPYNASQGRLGNMVAGSGVPAKRRSSKINNDGSDIDEDENKGDDEEETGFKKPLEVIKPSSAQKSTEAASVTSSTSALVPDKQTPTKKRVKHTE
jgi:hypothetical protein